MQIGFNSTALLNLNQHQSNAENALSKISAMIENKLEDTASATINSAISSQVGALTQGVENGNNAISMMQIADGALQGVSKSAAHLSELSVAMNNAALGPQGRSALSSEFDATVKSMSQSIESASFGTQKLFGSSLEFSLGNSTTSISLNNMDFGNLDINDSSTITTLQDQISANLIEVGSSTNGLKSSIQNNISSISNLSAASSQLSDVDLAEQINSFSRDNLLVQSGIFAQTQQTQGLQNSMQRLLG